MLPWQKLHDVMQITGCPLTDAALGLPPEFYGDAVAIPGSFETIQYAECGEFHCSRVQVPEKPRIRPRRRLFGGRNFYLSAF